MKATNIMYVHNDEVLYSAVEDWYTFPRKEMSKIFHLPQKTLQNMSNDDLDDYVYRYLSNYKNFVKVYRLPQTVKLPDEVKTVDDALNYISDIYGFSAENCKLENF